MKLTIEKMVYGGSALARTGGQAIFVEGALPGETVEAELTRQRPGFAEARLVHVDSPSSDRVQPLCPYFGACGGCQYQQAEYGAQAAIKLGILEETLGRAGLRELPGIGLHTAEPWGYRNRIRLHVDPHTHQIGYLRRGSRHLLPVDTCPIAAPVLQEALVALRQIALAHTLGARCAEVEMFTTGDLSQILLQITGRGDVKTAALRLPGLCETLRERLPRLTGAHWGPPAPETARPRRGRQRRPPAPSPVPERTVCWGLPEVAYRVGEHTYRVSAGSFFQANRFLVERLAELACTADTARLAWDLYAGVGLFSRRLADHFDQVVAVEGAPSSARDLRANLPGQTVREQSTLSFLRANSADRPDFIVLDPPRAGLGGEGALALAAVRSRAITYVSCDPATLARDLAVLVNAGYTLTALDLVDMFPQTFHLETVAKLHLR